MDAGSVFEYRDRVHRRFDTPSLSVSKLVFELKNMLTGKEKRQAFKAVCLEIKGYEKYLEDVRFREFFGCFGPQKIIAPNAIIDNKCRRCDKLLDEQHFVIGHTYWKHLYQPFCSEKCREKTEAEDAYSCQCIDADCNDCKHFKREGTFDKDLMQDKKKTKNLFPRIGGFKGTCLKYNVPAKAFPMTATGWACFEHRKSKK